MFAQKTAIILVLLFEEISLWPELSIPTPFQNPEGSTLSVTKDKQITWNFCV